MLTLQTFQEAERTDFDPVIISLNGIGNVAGFFSNVRIDRKTVPEGWYCYNFRTVDVDDEVKIAEIKNGYISVDFGGAFSTTEDLGIKEGESLFNDGIFTDFTIGDLQ